MGHLFRTDLIKSIHAARRVLTVAIADGLFQQEADREFEFATFYGSLDEWRAYTIAHRFLAGNVKPLPAEDDPLRLAAQELLARAEGEILLRERARAVRLRKLG